MTKENITRAYGGSMPTDSAGLTLSQMSEEDSDSKEGSKEVFSDGLKISERQD